MTEDERTESEEQEEQSGETEGGSTLGSAAKGAAAGAAAGAVIGAAATAGREVLRSRGNDSDPGEDLASQQDEEAEDEESTGDA